MKGHKSDLDAEIETSENESSLTDEEDSSDEEQITFKSSEKDPKPNIPKVRTTKSEN